MFYTIYKIINTLNGKIYIGKHQTKDLNDDYMGSGKHLIHSHKKYGIENFKKEILFVFDSEEEMNFKEAELVTEEFCLREDTYNLCPGGKGGWGYINQKGMNRTRWHKENNKTHMRIMNQKGISARNELLKNDEEYAKKYSKIRSDTTKKQIAEKGNPFKGKTHTDEWKKAQSILMKEKQIGVNNSQFGTMWITDGINNRKIMKETIIPEGWYKGRI